MVVGRGGGEVGYSCHPTPLHIHRTRPPPFSHAKHRLSNTSAKENIDPNLVGGLPSPVARHDGRGEGASAPPAGPGNGVASASKRSSISSASAADSDRNAAANGSPAAPTPAQLPDAVRGSVGNKLRQQQQLGGSQPGTVVKLQQFAYGEGEWDVEQAAGNAVSA